MDDFDKEIMDYFMQIGKIEGMDESFTKIFATMYLSPEELTLEDLAKETGYSLASICNKAKILESAGVIIKSRKPGSKRVYLSMEKNFLIIIRNKLLVKEEFIVKIAKEKIPAIIKKYESKAKSQTDKKKIKILEDYYKQIQKAEKIIPNMIKLFNDNI